MLLMKLVSAGKSQTEGDSSLKSETNLLYIVCIVLLPHADFTRTVVHPSFGSPVRQAVRRETDFTTSLCRLCEELENNLLFSIFAMLG